MKFNILTKLTIVGTAFYLPIIVILYLLQVNEKAFDTVYVVFTVLVLVIGTVLTLLITKAFRKLETMTMLTEEIMAAKEIVEENSLNLEALVMKTSTSVSQIKQTSELVSDNARIVAEAATLSVSISSEGEKAVHDSIYGVDRIKEQIESIAVKILELSAQTQAIGKIITSVDDIAKQSKLLAFNASIEASKAGEYGKGFSVVANEIKNLSEESKEATNKIGEILGEIQQLTNTAVMMTEDGTKLADNGVILSKIAGDAISKLVISIQNSSEAAIQISTSAMEQKAGMEQLEQTMRNVSFVGRN
jgi:methyl-accepting chemotaxis protein